MSDDLAAAERSDVDQAETILPVVFLGPSMPLAEARALLNASFRAPMRRGDLDHIGPGRLVAIIDGVFEQHLAVSPGEIERAIARGVRVVGGASMGALRAAEVPGMTGVGRIYGWYRSGHIDRDDEVALIFDPRSGAPLSVPLVNVRFALERLASLGTIDSSTADALLDAARRLSFKDRTYLRILREAGLDERSDAVELAALLEAHDLKRSDAHAVLEWIDRVRSEPAPNPTLVAPSPPPLEKPAPSPGASFVWESGDAVEVRELGAFLLLAGKLDRLVRERLAAEGPVPEPRDGQAQAVLVEAVRRWGWLSTEETQVSIEDLGISAEALDAACTLEAGLRGAAEGTLAQLGGAVSAEWLGMLLLDGIALKRAVMQIGSLRWFAKTADGDVLSAEDRTAARDVWARLNGAAHFHEVEQRWQRLGVTSARVAAAVDLIGLARRGAAPLAASMRAAWQGAETDDAAFAADSLLNPCPKPAGEARFAWASTRAEPVARDLAARIGITRIGMIGELGEFLSEDVHIAQAARPGGEWSSSYGSGKGRTAEGAVIGSVMEELEKWAQERFAARPTIRGSFAELNVGRPCVDPDKLDLPYDTPWHPHLDIDWLEVDDLLGGSRVLMPLDPLQLARGKHDICFSARGARKHMATNGLGAGFAREEACLHGLCELIERHAQRLAELFLSNPGGIGPHPYAFVRPDSLGERVDSLAATLGRNAEAVRLLDITSEIAIPTFMATVVRDRQRAEGFGTHPNAAIAAEMALLEAAQTVSSLIAGGREDLTIRARSLGRHERPRPLGADDSWFWLDRDAVMSYGPRCAGFRSDDVRDDLDWSLRRVRAAGLSHVLMIELTPPEAAPAHVVRMIVPGLESNNPFHTGERARLVVARDFLPRWC